MGLLIRIAEPLFFILRRLFMKRFIAALLTVLFVGTGVVMAEEKAAAPAADKATAAPAVKKVKKKKAKKVKKAAAAAASTTPVAK